ncbi:tRNA threonylcarbamoyl adenosine modification protein YeaZ [Vitreoscilla sp. C1]|uniref:tRNA (adenosine(37)-N6)-threonylcarbamoyltransferase complex dimerization subunit type 1 TsaB n=1 Tax=Vitreoscilla sp. (strain C1) TaxID=96942 RepID=UPI000CDCDB33|nr:tRNA (adenosine(37)-N6)-threonylcarbamoyltransferase complex dimerization subunit type 1 TsaB [Vitreoscilla sp. C1]AUZ03904.1 tRNA threonylcarbamoyl adenosine modification protein YeaZ [Vitreoscilla sp. C1]
MNADFSRPVLAIDTSTSYLSLAIFSQGQTWSHHEEVGTKQSALILPALDALLKQASLSRQDLGCIVYAQGPGAFTGLRIGLGVAQGLALAQNLPLIGIDCLEAIASLATNEAYVLAASDARMGEVFYAWFNTQNLTRLSEDMVGKAQDIALPEGITTATGIGNAYNVYAEQLPVTGRSDMPTAVDYLNLALSGRFEATDASAVHLRYVRNKVALTAIEQAARKTC